MRSVENDELVFEETEIPAYCPHCKRDGEVTMRARNGKIGEDGKPPPALDNRLFRPKRLFIQSASLVELQVADIRIGCEPCTAAYGSLSAAIFAEDCEDVGVSFPTMACGIDATLVLRNPTSKPVRVSAKFRGVAVYPDAS